MDMEALARAFVDHLIDSRYVGPNVPNSVGLTRRNLMNIYNLVSGQRRGIVLCQQLTMHL